MPRSVLFRILLLPIIAYLSLIALWIALPSPPSVHGGNDSHYHQDVLRSGRELTSEYTHERYTSQDGVPYLYADCFSVDWRLVSDVAHNSIVLHIGQNATVSLTELANVGAPYMDLTTSRIISTITKQGTLDGAMLPWFDEADACLLNWEVDHTEQPIDVRAIVLEPGVVQIWPESTHWHIEPLQMPPYDSSLKPLVTISNIPVAGDMTNIRQIQISDMTWRVPSRTYPIRLTLFRILKPVTLSVGEFFEGYIAPAFDCLAILLERLIKLAFYFLMLSVVALGCWSASRRPPNRLPFKEWLRQRFWLTKWLYMKPVDGWLRQFWITKWLYPKSRSRVIKGPGGVITEIEEEEEDESEYQHSDTDEGLTESPRLGTLNTPLDFFRSRAPLDDLLNTFQSTRWMTAPLGRARSPRRNRFKPSDGITIRDEYSVDVESKV